MSQPTLTIAATWLAMLLCMSGCQSGGDSFRGGQSDEGCAHYEGGQDHYAASATSIEYPDVKLCNREEAVSSFAPRSVDDPAPDEFWDLPLSEAVAIALSNSEVIKDLGGRVLSSADTTKTIYDPALIEADPRFGTEGALSAFDAQLSTSAFWSKNNREVNNITLGGGTRDIRQDLGVLQSELSKTATTGSRFSLRNLTTYDSSNQPGNLFYSGWDTQFEAEVRQPLLQGAGTTFNRIAGPNAQPGLNFTNGVLIARVNTDISVADFQAGVRDFVSQVEDAYWDLYFAYRHFDANRQARDSALQTWQVIRAQRGLPGGTAERVARAESQYFAFENRVQDALNGIPGAGRSVGIYRGERNLRRLMGLPSNDGRLIRPADKPLTSKVAFAWDDSLATALTHRVELRRQQWKIKRGELVLTASRNFLLPKLDTVARYRLRGFGDELVGDGPPNTSAFQDLGTGEHQEWQVGVELSVPLGYRQAWAGVRQAELQLARERAVYREQELLISHALSDAISEVDRAHAAMQAGYNRLGAAHRRLEAAREVLQVDRVSVDVVLEAQQELSEAQNRYFESLRDYAVALKNVQFEKGTLLAYNGIFLDEGPWNAQAYADAAELRKRLRPKEIDYGFRYPQPFAHPAPQPGLALGPAGEHVSAPGGDSVNDPSIAPPGAELLDSPPEVAPPEPQSEDELLPPVEPVAAYELIPATPLVSAIPSESVPMFEGPPHEPRPAFDRAATAPQDPAPARRTRVTVEPQSPSIPEFETVPSLGPAPPMAPHKELRKLPPI